MYIASVTVDVFKIYGKKNLVVTARGGVRSTLGLGPTMTAQGQSIGISIGRLPQTFLGDMEAITVQKTFKYYIM